MLLSVLFGKKEERRTCLTLPNIVLFSPRFLEREPVMVSVSCFNLGLESEVPTLSKTDEWTVVGGDTVDPSELDKLTYKFCIHTN